MNDAPLVDIRGLKKDYGGKIVLDGIDLSVGHGQIVGYLGANGAGKSTTIKILLGLVRDYRGEVRVAGFDPRTEALEIKKCVGYVPENAILYEQLTIAEFLLFVGRMQGLEDALIEHRSDEMLAAFELSDRLGSRIATLSKGMRQKVLLTSALLHAPQILFVDEPLSGLDVNASILIKTVFRGLADRGRTIFYSSHVMDVVQQICDRIVILDAGRIAAQGTFAELSAARSGGTLEKIFAEVTSHGGEEERAARVFAALD
jgi:ABC-2 type transport system ATP-binding protein